MKRQPHSATILKRWQCEESPPVLRRGGCQIQSIEIAIPVSREFSAIASTICLYKSDRYSCES
ncbi:MAG TPA: hypothetical protein DEF27_03410 [Oscillatoriales bacterium UBA8482]|nr:hypothetical protein [Oscillatoriales bacterium UBA8482]